MSRGIGTLGKKNNYLPSRKLAGRFFVIIKNTMTKINPRYIFPAICFLLVFLTYGQTLLGDFVFDDRNIIDHAAMLSDPNQLYQTLSSPYWTEEVGLYRPITLLSHALNFFFLGNSAWGFHLINLIFYALSIWLLALVLEKLFSNKILSYLAALIFLVLPIHTEVVANIVSRTEILALFFSLLVFWELLRDKIVWWRVGIWFALALGSKETAAATAPLVLLIVYLKEKNLFTRETLLKYLHPGLSLLAGGILYFAARWLVLGGANFLKSSTTIVENPLAFVSAKERIFTALKILTIYLQKIFWPVNLCSDYSYNQIPAVKNFFSAGVLIGVAFLFLLVVGIFIFHRRSPALSLSSAIFLFSFLPVSNLIFPIGTIAGERMMYFPSVGISIFLAWLILKICRLAPPKFFEYLFWSISLALIIFYGILSYQRAWDWLTEKKLFTSAAQCAPQSVLSRSNLGAAYYLEGNLVEAKKALLEARDIYPDYPKGVNNLGLVYWKMGDRMMARQLFLKALSYNFPYYGAYENLALMAIEEKNWQEAKDWLMKLYSDNGEFVEYYINSYRRQNE